MYYARVLADSIAHGVRLTTLEVCFPRFILAEFNTHRVFSRNSASSRAIPVATRIAQVRNNPFVPEAFGVNKSGMQASTTHGGCVGTVTRWLWILAARICCVIAWCLMKLDIHKQHANRVIELWAWHTVVVSATEWENFLNLRTHKAAQPEIQIVAKLIRDALAASTPRKLHDGDWHLPYATNDDHDGRLIADNILTSVVRSAAVSFERQNAPRSSEAVKKRHDDMMRLAHWSPFEHAACVATDAELRKYALYTYTGEPAFIGNFRAPWLQYRKTFENESVWQGGKEDV